MPKDRCPPSDIARWFINRADRLAGDDMTHLKLQKLIYFAQAWRRQSGGRHLAQPVPRYFDMDISIVT